MDDYSHEVIIDVGIEASVRMTLTRIANRTNRLPAPALAELVADQINWCEDNIKGGWTVSSKRSQFWSFRFERKEDATLFKMFWSEGA